MDSCQLLRVLVREWTEEDVIDQAENGGVCADTEREGKNGDSREAGVALKPADAVLQVLSKLVEPHRNPDGAGVLFRERDAPKLPIGGLSCLLGRQASGEVVLSLALDVVANLLVEVVKCPLAPDHGVSSPEAGRRIRVIA